jgi:hypothetical protein
VTADVTSSGVQPGDNYVLVDAENYYGAPVASGVWTAGQMLTVPMTNTAATQAAGMHLTITNTQPQFGAFVFLSGAAITGSGTTPNPVSPGVSISSFTASPATSPAPGSPVLLTCVAANATSVSINGTPSATLTVTPSTNTTYACSAQGNGGPVTATLPVSVTQPTGPVVATTATAAFVKYDTTTGGSWKGIYGAEGEVIANDSSNLPAYAQVNVAKLSSWTWVSSTTDARALIKANQSGRIASSWFDKATFDIDVNLTDGVSHQVALYVLDWDFNSRAERIDILDAGNGTILNSMKASNFTGGEYLVWNVSGHVIFRVTKTSVGSNAVVSGVLLGGSGVTPPVTAPPVAISSFTASPATSPAPGSPVLLACVTANATSVSINGTTGATLTVTPSTNTTYTCSAQGNGGPATATLTVQVTQPSAPPPPAATATATFVKYDTTTEGNWKGTYGSGGEVIANDSSNLPAYAQVNVANLAAWTWAGMPDNRALLKAGSTARIASTWYNWTTFGIDVNITSGTHQVALYVLDWDLNNRAERIDILDATSGALLDTRSVSNFTGGEYLVWNLSGHIIARVTKTNSSSNAVVSGVFINP